MLTPSYDKFHHRDDAQPCDRVRVLFRGEPQDVEIFSLTTAPGVRTLLFHHPLLAPGEPGAVYHDDGGDRPFATDASTFAFFCAACAVWVSEQADRPEVVHLHDWHAAWYLLMRDFTPLGETLGKIRTVFTIHNLAYQGQRPFEGDESSLVAWFPGLLFDPAPLRDPHAANAVNPMAYAIRVADAVNTVSPSYALEICRPSNHAAGFYGGEGLHEELAKAGKRLSGILNGCDYSDITGRHVGWNRIRQLAREQLRNWQAHSPDEAHDIALANLDALPAKRPANVLTSIGRVVEQKMQLFFQPLADGRSALEHILDRLGRRGALLLLGSGEKRYELALVDTARRYGNLVFMRGYSEELGNALYRTGDFFLMPSSFEPCGISQMQAMRVGQPCIVHGVGGLRDTVTDSKTGFVFDGLDNPGQQASNFVASVGRAIDMKRDHPESFKAMQAAARAVRFDWKQSAREYIEKVYEHDSI